MIDLTCTNKEKILVAINPEGEYTGPLDIQMLGGDGSVEVVDDRNFWILSGDLLGDTSYLVSIVVRTGGEAENIFDVIVLHVVPEQIITGRRKKNLNFVVKGNPVPKE